MTVLKVIFLKVVLFARPKVVAYNLTKNGTFRHFLTFPKSVKMALFSTFPYELLYREMPKSGKSPKRGQIWHFLILLPYELHGLFDNFC